jgi:hypothetical protein
MVTELLASLFFGLSIFFLRSSFLMAASLLSSRRIININGSEAIDNTVSHVVLEASGKVEQLSCFEELNPTNCVRNPKNSSRRLHRCAFRWDGKKAACSQKNTTKLVLEYDVLFIFLRASPL